MARGIFREKMDFFQKKKDFLTSNENEVQPIVRFASVTPTKPSKAAMLCWEKAFIDIDDDNGVCVFFFFN